MTIQNLDEHIKNNTLKPLYVLYGEEDYLICSKLNKIRQAILKDGFEDFNLHKFDGNNADTSEIFNAVNSYPQFSDKKLVIFNNTEIFTSPQNAATKFFATLISDIPEFTHCVFTEKGVDNRKASLKKAFEAKGEFVKFDYLKPEHLRIWLERKFEADGKRINTSDLAYITDISHPSMRMLDNEYEKIINYIGNREKIGKEDIDAVITKTAEGKYFDVFEDIFSGNKIKAYTALQRMRLSDESGIAAIALLQSNISEMLMVLNLDNSGNNTNRAKKYFAPNRAWIIPKIKRNAKNFGKDFLRRMLIKGNDYNYGIKNGKIDEYTALILYASEIMTYRKN